MKPPVPSDPWTDPLKAFKYGAPCAQRRRSTNTTSEDCLFLNIFVPGKESFFLRVYFIPLKKEHLTSRILHHFYDASFYDRGYDT